MGTSSSNIQNHNFINHSKFGKVILNQSLLNQYHCITIQTITILPNPDPIQRWINLLKQNVPYLSIINNNQDINITFNLSNKSKESLYSSLLIPIKYSWKVQGLCGQGGILQTQYQAFMFDLDQQIQNRINQGKYFLQTQIWFLLFKLIQLETQFQQIGKKIGNLHPSNILINDDGQIKVVSKYSVLGGLDNFEQKLQNIYAKAFIAPEQIQGINNRQQAYFGQMKQNPSQIFSLGITILCAATLNSGDQFYKIDQSSNLLSINLVSIQQRLKSLGQHYSSFLYAVIESMVKLKPADRKQASQIYESLREYQKVILDLEPFLPTQNMINLIRQRRWNNESNIKINNGYQGNDEYQKWKLSQQRRLNNFYKKFKY